MSETPSLSHHPAPHADRVGSWETFFGVWGAPAAWFVQLCVNYALAGRGCDQFGTPTAGDGKSWNMLAMAVTALITLLIALLATSVAWRSYRRTQREQPGGHPELLEIGAGRTRFLAFWGIVFGVGFSLTILFTALGQEVLPRCSG